MKYNTFLVLVMKLELKLRKQMLISYVLMFAVMNQNLPLK